MIKLIIDGKARIIRKINKNEEPDYFEGFYHGWFIHIFPMWGKIVAGRYRDDLKTGEVGVDVSGPDGGRIVDAVAGSKRQALEMALTNILTCRPRYSEN